MFHGKKKCSIKCNRPLLSIPTILQQVDELSSIITIRESRKFASSQFTPHIFVVSICPMTVLMLYRLDQFTFDQVQLSQVVLFKKGELYQGQIFLKPTNGQACTWPLTRACISLKGGRGPHTIQGYGQGPSLKRAQKSCVQASKRYATGCCMKTKALS